MRSWPRLGAALGAGALTGFLAALAACGTDVTLENYDKPPIIDPDVCETSYLTYGNFGEPFITNWCRGCHSSDLPANMRQMAPVAANFDDLTMVKSWGNKIAAKAGSNPASMPPAGGPSDEERAMLREWIGCGLK
jgi:hypothetical protein